MFALDDLSVPARDDGTDDIRDLISVAMVINAYSTLVEFFAEVSKNGIFNDSAYSYCTNSSNDILSRRNVLPTFALLYCTTFFTVKSDLFPTNSLFTFSLA